MRRYGGAWHTEAKVLYPGYVFLESDAPEVLEQTWKEQEQAVRVLGLNSELTAVNKEEEQFLRMLCGEKHHFGMSRGIIRDGSAYVTEGPLKGKEQLIRRIERHKRLAKIRIPHMQEMYVGLEITRKE